MKDYLRHYYSMQRIILGSHLKSGNALYVPYAVAVTQCGRSPKERAADLLLTRNRG